MAEHLETIAAIRMNKVRAMPFKVMPLTYCDEIAGDILTMFDKTDKYESGKIHYTADGIRQYVGHNGRSYQIDIRPLQEHPCPKCGAPMFYTGREHGEWWCTAGCDDPARKEK